jgi:two-component system, OmpR family, phosphate regulon sensor histidine kinase PhoR
LHTTWRAYVALGLLTTGAALAGFLATAMSLDGAPVWQAMLAWLLVSVLAAGAFTSWLHFLEAERLRRSLARGLTHHCRTSLAHIRTFNEMLLLERDSSEEERREWLEVIGREAERLGTSVENVLLLVTDRRSAGYPVRRRIDLCELVEDTAAAFAVGARHLEVSIEPGAPLEVLADREALHHAVLNLIDATAADAVAGDRLTLAVDRGNDAARLTITAEPGDGRHRPSAAHRGAAFLRDGMATDPLALETDASYGLEIAVARHVIRQHGGRIVPIEEGTRRGFRMELPTA